MPILVLGRCCAMVGARRWWMVSLILPALSVGMAVPQGGSQSSNIVEKNSAYK